MSGPRRGIVAAALLALGGRGGSDSTSLNTLNAGLVPSAAGASHTFSILDLGASMPRTIAMVSAAVVGENRQSRARHPLQRGRWPT